MVLLKFISATAWLMSSSLSVLVSSSRGSTRLPKRDDGRDESLDSLSTTVMPWTQCPGKMKFTFHRGCGTDRLRLDLALFRCCEIACFSNLVFPVALIAVSASPPVIFWISAGTPRSSRSRTSRRTERSRHSHGLGCSTSRTVFASRNS